MKGKRASEYKLQKELKIKLKKEIPEVLNFITSLQECLQRQQKQIKKLKHKLKKLPKLVDIGIQTETEYKDAKCFTEDIKEAAEIAMLKSGFVYEETSGMYYHYESGYYYNAELGLYYDGNTGTYMKYNNELGKYEFHSQVETVKNPSSDVRYKSRRKTTNREKSKGCKKEPKDDLDLEDGECSDSTDTDEFDRENDTPTAWPPCMRIMIKSSSIPEIKEGALHIITMEGGSLGREGQHSIVIPDINVSKEHLKFEFDKSAGKYLITDVGSRNGTTLDGKRLSASKEESEALEVSHGSQIQIGGVVLLCHIHSGNETCGHCEPGLLQQQTIIERPFVPSKQQQYKKELRNLKKKFGIETYGQPKLQIANGYTDRADERRKTVGSLNENEKTEVASTETSIPVENKGYKLLAKMGWSENQSLGKDGTGIKNPIEVNATVGTAGVGFKGFSSQVNVNQSKASMWKAVQKRYESLDSGDIFPNPD